VRGLPLVCETTDNSCRLMNTGDAAFNARTQPLPTTIAEERLQIAHASQWPTLVTEISGDGVAIYGRPGNVRWCFTNPKGVADCRASARPKPKKRLSIVSTVETRYTPAQSPSGAGYSGCQSVAPQCRLRKHRETLRLVAQLPALGGGVGLPCRKPSRHS